MNSLTRLLLMLLLISCLLSGCWSASDIERKGYVKALGIDFIDNEFIVYAQLLDFSSIAKSESSGGSSTNPNTSVGIGKGRTLNLATDDLYHTSQVTMTWGHLSSVLISEKALKTEGLHIIDMLNRYPEIRYNTWLYITQESIETIFTTTSLFRMPSLFSILHDPIPNYAQLSLLPPVPLFKYIAHYNEPGITAYIPSIGVNKTQWRQSSKSLPLLTLTGAFFESPKGKNTFISKSKLSGYEWMQKEMKRAPLVVTKNGQEYANLSLTKPKIKVKPIVKGDDITFRISVKFKGSMFEYNKPIAYREMIQIAEKTVEEQIMNVYKEGLKANVDIYNLGDALRHDNLNAWKRLSNNGKSLVIDSHSIEKLEVKIIIPYNGKYKRITS